MFAIGDYVKFKKPEEIKYFKVYSDPFWTIIANNQGVVYRITNTGKAHTSTTYYLEGMKYDFFENELEPVESAAYDGDSEFVSIMF